MNRTLRNLSVAALALALGACASAPTKDDSARPDEPEAPATRPANTPVTSVQDGLTRGDEAWRRGNLDLALYLFVQALQFDSRNTELMAKIGALHESRGNLELAARAFELAHEYDPDDARLSERLGLLLIAQGKQTAAAKALSEANRTTPGRWRTLDGLGQLALINGNDKQALAFFEEARLASPRSALTILHRGETYLRMGNDAAAEHDARFALTLAGEALPDAWRCLGRAQANQKKYDAALDSFQRVGTLAAAYNSVGEIAIRNSDYVLARAFLESAAQASPVYYEAAYHNLELVAEKLRSRSRPSGS
jgi:tetratricopeptide (TPR) repeat protein